MPKKAFLPFALLTIAACFLSYKLGSAPVASAGTQSAQLDGSGRVPPTLPTAPGTWTAWSSVVPGQKAVATRAAGGSGVKHVATCVSATVINDNSGVAEPLFTLQLLDGTNVVMEWQQGTPAGEGLTYELSLCGLNVVGSANTAMTFQYAIAAPGGVYQSVNLVGYDAQ